MSLVLAFLMGVSSGRFVASVRVVDACAVSYEPNLANSPVVACERRDASAIVTVEDGIPTVAF